MADYCDNASCDDERAEFTLAIGVISFVIAAGCLVTRYFAKVQLSDKVYHRLARSRCASGAPALRRALLLIAPPLPLPARSTWA